MNLKIDEALSYNTQRAKLHIPEYGRNVQNMIEHAKTIADKAERNSAAQAIIEVMGQLNPHLRDIEDYKHKLWTHMFIMSDFELDVDSPYPIPKRDTLTKPPKLMKYPTNKSKFGHFGHYTEKMIEEASKVTDADEKEYLTLTLGNLMKKNYLLFHTENVENGAIANYLKDLSEGTLTLENPEVLKHTRQIMKEHGIQPHQLNNNHRRKSNKQRKRKNK